MAALVNLRYVVHLADEGRFLIRREAPHRLEPGFQRVFFMARRTVSCEIDSTTSSSIRRSAKSRNDQRAWPAGAFEQASAVSRACFSPSSLGVTAGRVRGVRCSSGNGPRSTACLRHDSRLRVVTPYASAMCSSVQAGPSGPWSHWSSACARCNFHPATLPLRTTRWSSARSSAVNVRTYFLGTIPLPDTELRACQGGNFTRKSTCGTLLERGQPRRQHTRWKGPSRAGNRRARPP